MLATIGSHGQTGLMQLEGNSPPTIPFALRCADVHAHEHQDWRLQ
jgi:hypothetical protein